jgi:hypothetical protein
MWMYRTQWMVLNMELRDSIQTQKRCLQSPMRYPGVEVGQDHLHYEVVMMGIMVRHIRFYAIDLRM